MVDVYLHNVETGCELLNDSQLLFALIFAKKSVDGGLSVDDYVYLENMRKELDITDPILFAKLLDKIRLIYQKHYFNRRKN